MSTYDAQSWVREHKPEMWLIFSHNFIDFFSIDEAFRMSVSVVEIAKFDTLNRVDVAVPLEWNHMYFKNALINPFAGFDDDFFFLAAGKASEFDIQTTKTEVDNTDINWSPMNFKVTVEMDDKINLMSRRRYNVWDLLGAMGGL